MLSETLTQLVQTYGFKVVYEGLMGMSNTLLEKYKSEISFIESLGVQNTVAEIPNTVVETQNTIVENTSKEIQITAAVVQDAIEKGEGKEITVSEARPKKMKVIRKGGKFIKVETPKVENEILPVVVQKAEEIQPVENTTEGKRTPKEIKKWQREQESARRKYMKENDITLKSVLVESQIKQYLDEGKTYAWIAREITGQKEEEVSKWCRGKGLQRIKVGNA